MRIPIVMVSDENYIFQTRVAIWTMRKSTCKDVLLDITILCSEQLGRSYRARLIELETIWENLKITFFEVAPEIFVNAKPVERIPISSFYRLIISEILSEDKKCLFLDGDIIVDTDLWDLYSQEMGDSYIAGVRDSEFLCDPDAALRHFKEYGFENISDYVNAGVMIFNLDKLRRDHLQKQFLESMKLFYPYMDQDILNKVCDGNVKLLELKYNYFTRYKNKSIKIENTFSLCKDDLKNEKEWEILHFAGAYKPWDNIRIRGSYEWWTCAKEALEKDIYKKLYDRAKDIAVKSDWSYILGRCLKANIVVVVGYSRIGIDVFTSLKRGNVKAEIVFGDNSNEKQNLSDQNVIIYSIEKLASKYPDALWINTSQRRFLEINEQLKDFGIHEEQIVVYKNKDESYFEMLDDIYVEHELKQLQLKSLGTIP